MCAILVIRRTCYHARPSMKNDPQTILQSKSCDCPDVKLAWAKGLCVQCQGHHGFRKPPPGRSRMSPPTPEEQEAMNRERHDLLQRRIHCRLNF